MTIKLSDILRIDDQHLYKVHFARWNQRNQPLDVFVRDPLEWQSWQEYKPGRDDFNRPHILALIQFYHEADAWLFGGVFDVVERHACHYKVALSHIGRNFIGRLKLHSSYRSRTTRVNLENHYSDFEVLEVLRELYSGRPFPGYEDINVSFDELESLVRNERPDWKAALENIKGVYLIVDVKTEMRYVGSAYGDAGIWSRWSEYVSSGHGGNVELRQLVTDPNLEYCRQYFRFALLEHRPKIAEDKLIFAREAHWKRLLLTRGENGLNRN
ncbi:MAG: GIY-YIG nuclease family protein [Sphingomonadales bacterium]|nr:GIY-YIG nuclease family protein [Sphingomonadales bacterium]